MTSKNQFNYPANNQSEEIKDFIIFNAYSNSVSGYTKLSTNAKNSAAIRGALSEQIGRGIDNVGSLLGIAANEGNGNKSHEGSAQLYIPEKLSVESKSNFEGTSGGTLISNFANVGVSADGIDSIASAGQALGQVLGGIKDVLGSGLETADENAAVGIQATGGTVGNANRHVLFKGVDFRTFQYDYTLLPKSYEESVMLKNMIRWFRINMLPELGPRGNKFKPPNYFTIEYYVDGLPSNYLNKIKPSVCTDLKVDYGGDGGAFAMFQSESGEEAAPSTISLSLSFQEIQLVTKEDAAIGY